MSTLKDRIAALRVQLSELEAEDAAEDRVARVADWEKVRTELHERMAFVSDNRPVFHQQKENWDNGVAHLQQDGEAIARALREKPGVVDLLPNDPESLRWKKHHDGLLVRRARHQAELNALPNPDLLQAELSAALARIRTLEFSDANFERVLSGKSGKAFAAQGGISGVR